jgi:hypothetical protein
MQFVRYVHNPLTQVPLIGRLFDHVTEYPGNHRTVSVAVTFRNVPKWMEN